MLRIVVGLLIVGGLGGLALVLFISMNTPPPPVVAVNALPPPPVVAPPVIVPTQVLAVGRAVRGGTLLVIDDLTPHAVLPGQEPRGSFRDTIADRDQLRGAMVRRGLEPGDIILRADVLRPGDRGFLAAVLRPGMRAVTVGVDPVSGTAGLIWPGDRVDLVLTQTSEDKDQPIDRRIFSETVLRDARAIAVDQQLVQGGQSTGQTAGALAPSNRTVTLETTPFDAERVATAVRMGRLSLVIRSSAEEEPRATSANCAAATHVAQLVVPGAQRDSAVPAAGCEATDTVPIAWGGSVSPALNDRPPAARPGASMHVHTGNKAAEEVKF